MAVNRIIARLDDLEKREDALWERYDKSDVASYSMRKRRYCPDGMADCPMNHEHREPPRDRHKVVRPSPMDSLDPNRAHIDYFGRSAEYGRGRDSTQKVRFFLRAPNVVECNKTVLYANEMDQSIALKPGEAALGRRKPGDFKKSRDYKPPPRPKDMSPMQDRGKITMLPARSFKPSRARSSLSCVRGVDMPAVSQSLTEGHDRHKYKVDSSDIPHTYPKHPYFDSIVEPASLMNMLENNIEDEDGALFYRIPERERVKRGRREVEERYADKIHHLQKTLYETMRIPDRLPPRLDGNTSTAPENYSAPSTAFTYGPGRATTVTFVHERKNSMDKLANSIEALRQELADSGLFMLEDDPRTDVPKEPIADKNEDIEGEEEKIPKKNARKNHLLVTDEDPEAAKAKAELLSVVSKVKVGQYNK